MAPRISFPPVTVLTLGLVLAGLHLGLCLYSAVHAPWLGFTLKLQDERAIIDEVDIEGPARLLLIPGQELKSINSPDGKRWQITPLDLVTEPDDLNTFSEYNLFFQRQALLHDILQNESVLLELTSGPTVWLSPDDTRPLVSQPLRFWVQLISGVVVFILGIVVSAFGQRDWGARYFALSALGVYITITCGAVYGCRELGLQPDLFLLLSQLAFFGSLLFAGTATAMLWYFPNRVGRFPYAAVMILLVSLCLIVIYGQYVENIDLIFRGALIFWFLVDVILAVMQWRLSQGHPVARAQLKWFLLAWFICMTLFFVSMTLPLILGIPTLVSHTLGWTLFPIAYGVIALGINRYRLVELDRWILGAGLWLIGGLTVIALDILLIMAFELSESVSLLVALTAIGWLYFPARQWLLDRWSPSAARSRGFPHFAELLDAAFADNAQSLGQWHRTLKTLFDPVEIKPSEIAIGEPRVTDNGLKLHLPGFGTLPACELGYANGGKRLFNSADEKLASQTLRLFNYMLQQRDSFQRGVLQERKRVARDLHDDIGSRLLSIIYRSEGTEVSELARETLGSLRELMQGLKEESISLEEAMQRWQIECLSRCQMFDISLQFNNHCQHQDWILTPRVFNNISRVLREALTNTIKHANATRVDVLLHNTEHHLIVAVSDNGDGMAPQQQSSGLGMENIRTRIEELGGMVTWLESPDKGTLVVIDVPIIEGDAD